MKTLFVFLNVQSFVMLLEIELFKQTNKQTKKKKKRKENQN